MFFVCSSVCPFCFLSIRFPAYPALCLRAIVHRFISSFLNVGMATEVRLSLPYIASQQSCISPKSIPTCQLSLEEKNNEDTLKREMVTYSQLSTAEHDCPLSSMLNLPLSKGMSGLYTAPTSTLADVNHPLGQQFIPVPVRYPFFQVRLQGWVV